LNNTNRDSVRNLCKSILTRLANRKAVELQAESRTPVQDEVYDLVGEFILTEHDLHTQTLDRVGAKADDLLEDDFTQSAPYRTARSMVRKTFGDDELNGFYYQKSLKHIAQLITIYLMKADKIEDVFESDEVLEKMIIDVIRTHRPSEQH